MQEQRSSLSSAKDIADLFGVTERRVQQLAKEGILPIAARRPYRFDERKTVREYVRYLTEKAAGRERKTASKAEAEADRVRADADFKQSKAKIAQMQLKELEGKLHRSEDVEAATNDLVFAIRGMIMALPGHLAMDVAQAESAAEASEIIRAECYKILEELAGYQYDPDAYRQRVQEREGWSDLSDGEDE